MPESSFLLSPPEIIEGIGPRRAAALRESGITTIAELFGVGPRRVHALCPTAGAEEVGQWFCKAMLTRVKGVTPDLADAFVTSDIRSVQALANVELEALEAAVERGRSAGRLRAMPTLYQLSDIQKAAWKLAGFGMLAGRLLHRNGRPARAALVDIGSQDSTTDGAGWYAFDKVRAGRIRPRITVSGHPVALEIRPLEIRDGKLTGPKVLRLAPVRDTPFTLPRIREMDGHLIANTRATRVELVWRPLDEFADGAILQVRSVGRDGYARLLSLYKEQVGTVIFVPRARVKNAELPAGAGVGNVLRYTDGGLVATSLTPGDVAELKRRAWIDSAVTTTRQVIRIE